MVQRVCDVEQPPHHAGVVGGVVGISSVHGVDAQRPQALGSAFVLVAGTVADNWPTAPSTGAAAASGKHIFSPSHRWPHQHWPSALMMQVPVPQHRRSSDMGLLL
jgi:hypothetical protein